jgi:hypothetical protein
MGKEKTFFCVLVLGLVVLVEFVGVGLVFWGVARSINVWGVAGLRAFCTLVVVFIFLCRVLE